MTRILIATILSVTAALSSASEAGSDLTPVVETRSQRLRTSLPSPTDQASLTAFLAQMPKGGDLHHHYSGAVYAETYLDWAKRKGMLIDPQTLMLGGQAPNSITIDSLRKNSVLHRKVLEAWSDLDYGNHYATSLPPDQQFFGTFGYFGAISNAFLADGLQEIKQRAILENVQYIESMLKSVDYRLADAEFDALVDSLRIRRDETGLRAALAKLQAKVSFDPVYPVQVGAFTRLVDSVHRGIDDSGFTMRYQTYVSRNSPPSVVFSNLMAAFKAAASDTLIVGVNIVGPENEVVAMRDEWLHVRMFLHMRNLYPNVRVAMHAGELRLGLVKPEDLTYHVNDAVFIARANRIGHGVDLAYERSPMELLSAMRGKNICLEANLTSNEFILGVSGSAHPIQLYRKAGVPVTLSTDDAGVSRNSLTSEYVLLATRYGLSYDEIKQIVLNSVECSFLSSGSRDRLRQQVLRRFQAFEQGFATGRILPVAHHQP